MINRDRECFGQSLPNNEPVTFIRGQISYNKRPFQTFEFEKELSDSLIIHLIVPGDENLEQVSKMKICVAQTSSAKGSIQANLAHHQKFVDLAAMNGADIIIFPELSLTGYEPTLARALATDQYDTRFDILQRASHINQMTIGVGVPTKKDAGICISMVLFHPHQERQTYSKKYLHPDEDAFFIPGENLPDIKVDNTRIAFAICYELSITEHAENAHKNGASIYIASVAKFANGFDKAVTRLSEIAQQYSQMVLMSNCVGYADGHVCGGKTSIWNSHGVLVAQLNAVDEGLLIIDTVTHEVIKEIL